MGCGASSLGASSEPSARHTSDPSSLPPNVEVKEETKTGNNIEGTAQQPAAKKKAITPEEGTLELVKKAAERAACNVVLTTVLEGDSSGIEQISGELQAAVTEAESALRELQKGDFSGTEAVAETLISVFVKGVSAMDAERRPVSIQDVQLPEYATAEKVFNKYSALGQVLVSVVQHSVSGLPFGAPVASIIGLIYSRAAQATLNTVGAKGLLTKIKHVDRCLAKLASTSGSTQEEDLKAALRLLPKVLQEAAVLLSAYSGRGFFKRFLLSSHDEGQFTRLTTEITDAMHTISFTVAMDNLGGGPTVEEPNISELRRAMLKAANMPEDNGQWSPEKADEVMKACGDKQLRMLMRTHGKVEEQFIQSELDALDKRVREMERKVDEMYAIWIDLNTTKQGLLKAGAESQLSMPPALNAYLSKWWTDMFEIMQQVPSVMLVTQLSKWMIDHKLEDKLRNYDSYLETEGIVPTARASSPEAGSIFLRGVLLPLLKDEKKDNYVSRVELLAGQMKADNFAAKRPDIPYATDWPSMLDVFYQCFDRFSHAGIIGSIMAGHATDPGMTGNPRERAEARERVEALLLQLEEKLQVKPIIQSYNITRLLSEYVEGTRGWLYEDVNAWLAQAVASGSETSASSRAYLLISGPGMGKSIFSAVLHTRLISPSVKGPKLILVKHFFKVGEARAQASSMVLSLAYQLAEKLPGMMELLTLVAQMHGTGSNLELEDIFDNFLLKPLKKLEIDSSAFPVIVILLDALDEADYVGQGWMPVTRLVANKFPSLPACMKLVLTSRPQTVVSFKAWLPHIIEPKANENMEDVSKLLQARVKACERVKPEDISAAVQVLKRKSQGQLIYTKYTMDYMRLKPNWTVAELEMGLPEGLGGAYTLVLTILTTTLSRDKGNGPELLKLLNEKVLPVLVATQEPISPKMLAWACGCLDSGCSEANITEDELGDVGQHEKKYADGIRGQVDELLDLLSTIFPTRALTSSATSVSYVIQPYHKSVLDWLLCKEGMDSGMFRVDVVAGHKVLGAQLLKEAFKADVQPSDYCKKYAAEHLCQSGLECSQLLDLLLSNWDFLRAVITSGQGGKLLASLGAVAREGLSPYGMDTYRWLARCLNDFELSSQSLEDVTVSVDVMCPVGCIKFQEATKRLGWAWVPRLQLGGYGSGWPPDTSTLKGHSNTVYIVSFSPDGKQLATGSGDNTAKVWDLGSGTCTATLQGHSSPVSSVSFSPDGKQLATGSNDNKIAKVWDLGSGTCTVTLQGHSSDVNSVSFSPDGKQLATGSADDTAKVWDLGSDTCTDTLQGHSSYVFSVSFSPDGKQLATGSRDKTAKVWDLGSGTCTDTLQGHSSYVKSVSFSPDGKQLATGSYDKTAKVWDLGSGTCTATLQGHSYYVSSVSFSPDGKQLATGSRDKTAKVWDLGSGTCTDTLQGHSNYVYSVSFSPDGKQLATG